MKFAKIFEAAEVCPFVLLFFRTLTLLGWVETISEGTRRVFSFFPLPSPFRFSVLASFVPRRLRPISPSLPRSLPCFPLSLLPSLNPRFYLPSSFPSAPPSSLHFLPSLSTFSLPLSLLGSLFPPVLLPNHLSFIQAPSNSHTTATG